MIINLVTFSFLLVTSAVQEQLMTHLQSFTVIFTDLCFYNSFEKNEKNHAFAALMFCYSLYHLII